jgi:hypothetical protein
VSDPRLAVGFGRLLHPLVRLFSLSCPPYCLHAHSYPCRREHINQVIDAETADLSLQQVTDAELCLAKESGRLGLSPPTRANVLAQVEQQVRLILKFAASPLSNPTSSKYVIVAVGDFGFPGIMAALADSAGLFYNLPTNFEVTLGRFLSFLLDRVE